MRYKTAIYNFSQITPLGDIDLMVTGECEVSYKLCRKEPDVGIMDDWFEFDVERIWLHPIKADGQNMELRPESWLYGTIRDYLGHEEREYIEEFLADDYEPADY